MSKIEEMTEGGWDILDVAEHFEKRAEAWKAAAEQLEQTLHWDQRLADSYTGDTRGLAMLRNAAAKLMIAARKLEE